MNPDKIVSLPTAKPARKRAPKKVLTVAKQRTVGQCIAATAAGFLPIASYVLAHGEAQQTTYLWALVAAALLYSAPTLAAWSRKWAGSDAKAWGFTVLLEGVMVASQTVPLSASGLVLLVAINAHAAYLQAGAKLKA
jgi:hypothetical protein